MGVVLPTTNSSEHPIRIGASSVLCLAPFERLAPSSIRTLCLKLTQNGLYAFMLWSASKLTYLPQARTQAKVGQDGHGDSGSLAAVAEWTRTNVSQPQNPGGSSPSKCGSYPANIRHSDRSASSRTSFGIRSRPALRESARPLTT